MAYDVMGICSRHYSQVVVRQISELGYHGNGFWLSDGFIARQTRYLEEISTTICSYEDLPNQELDNLKQNHEVVIVMVPFPSQGHLNQLLQLAYLISSSYDLPVYDVGSASHNCQARVRSNAINPSDIEKIHFHDIPTPEFASPSPIFNALRKFPSIVVSYLNNAESYRFNCLSGFGRISCLFSGMSIQLGQDLLKNLPSLEGSLPDEFRDFRALQGPYMDIRSGDIHNTSKVIEGEFLDLLVQAESKQQWEIGPILPTKLDHVSNRNNICLKWLNKQPPRSVIYIYFGRTTTFSDSEIMELAVGLEQSKLKFIWVLREVDRRDIFTGEARRFELLEGFEERIKEAGLVVREWAPQPEILAHSSTGRFISHCGWNSCIESITMGVPISAWPMHADQPRNSFLVMKVLKIGLLVREWEKREELVSSSSIENVVRKLMASEEGDAIRKRAEELGEVVVGFIVNERREWKM
ncbi:putative zeatin O-glucosyltransferase-like [Capsicum annuum]|nr:putative zeatin O-glucosyltransferase-like [Capsicum annuum]